MPYPHVCELCQRPFVSRNPKAIYCSKFCSRQPTMERYVRAFWRKVARCDHGEQCAQCCWLWQAYISPSGYGSFQFKQKPIPAYRFAYMMTHGDIFPGLCICHRCDVRACVNPQHLWVGTVWDNTHDAIEKQRMPRKRGDQCPWSKVTAAQVEEIRHAAQQGVPRRILAPQYGLSRSHLNALIRGVWWKHVPLASGE